MSASGGGGQSGRWQLDRAAFAALLSALHANQAVAAREYERLRSKLVRYFAINGIARAAEATDEAFNRLARRLSQGEAVRTLEAYLAGIARLVVLEERQRQQRERRMVNEWVAVQEPSQDDEQVLEVLESCLRELPQATRELLSRYYTGDGGARARAREALARDLGLSGNSLRNRVLRLRQKLERQVRARMNEASRDERPLDDTLTEEEE